jgi:SET domain-containing protein
MPTRSATLPAEAGSHKAILRQLPKITRRRSKLHGFGVFAAEPINKNTRIIDYAGELVHNSKTTPREVKYLKQGCIWVFRVNRAWSRDAAVDGNVARFINHACKPNCYSHIVDGIIWIRAGRTIEPGEELSYDYYTGGTAEIPCQCRPNCKGKI